MKHVLQLLSMIALLTSTVSVSLAQKIDLDRVSVRNEYIGLPENGALLGFNTYSVNFNIDPAVISQCGYTGNKLTDFGTLNGFGYRAEAGDFTYTLIIEKPITLPGVVEERKSEMKNAAGQKVPLIKYVGKLRQAIPTTIALIERATSREIFKREFGKQAAPYEIPSQEFDNKAQAEAFANVKDGVIHETILNNYKKRLEADLDMIKRTFTPKKKEDKDVFWEVDIKKAPEYAPFNQELAKAKTILEKQSYNQSLDKSKQDMAPILKYWSDNVGTVQLADPKASQKLKYAYLINLAKAQFWLEMFDDCEKTCQQIIANEYDKEDAKDLQKLIALAKSDIKIAKVSSRHFYRKGFDDQTKFEYGNVTLKQTKDIGASLKDIHKSAKKDLVRKTVKDTIDSFETDLSDFKCTLNGKEIGLKHNQLQNGSGNGLPKEDGSLGVRFNENETIIPLERAVEFFHLNLYPNMTIKEGFGANDLLALIKENDGKDLVDINIGSDSIGYFIAGAKSSSKVILPKDYAQNLSVDAQIKLNNKDNPDLGGTYRTNTGDKFKIKLVETIPVAIGERAQYLKSNGYLVTLLIPELTLNKIKCMEPWCYLNGEMIKLENVRCTFLMLSR